MGAWAEREEGSLRRTSCTREGGTGVGWLLLRRSVCLCVDTESTLVHASMCMWGGGERGEASTVRTSWLRSSYSTLSWPHWLPSGQHGCRSQHWRPKNEGAGDVYKKVGSVV